MQVVGITGTLGAGKGAIVDLLCSKHGFVHFSVRGYLLEEIRRRDMPENRDSMRVVANDLRAKNTPAFIIEELLKEAVAGGKNSIIESIRTTGEIEALRSMGLPFKLLAVDADPALRYQRAFARKSETDSVTFEKFIADEQAEQGSEDPGVQNLAKCIELADIQINNSGTIKELESKVAEAMGL